MENDGKEKHNYSVIEERREERIIPVYNEESEEIW